MFYCLINSLPWGREMTSNQRFTRTFIIGLVCYAIIYMMPSFDQYQVFKVGIDSIRSWLWIIFGLDLALLGIITKGFFGYNLIKSYMIGTPKREVPKQIVNNQPHLKLKQINDLDVDLITEHGDQNTEHGDQNTEHGKVSSDETNKEVKKEVDKSKEVDPSKEVNNRVINTEVVNKEVIDIVGEKDDDIEIDTEVDVVGDGTVGANTVGVEGSPPKLTHDNINKYVTGKSKIIVNQSVRSEDLNLDS